MGKKHSVFRQSMLLLVSHLIACLLIFILIVGILSYLKNYRLIQIIIGIIAVVFYSSYIFTSANNCSVADNKSYSSLKPYAAKGFVLSVPIVAFIAAVWVWYLLSWKYLPLEYNDESFHLQTVIATFAYTFITSHMYIFVDVQGASFSLTAQIFAFLIPVASSFAGYYAGYRKWDVSGYFSKYIYDKNNKKDGI